jgi:2-dehydro-3-deoxygluconokinase
MKKSELIFENLKKSRLVALLTPGSAEDCQKAYEMFHDQGIVLEIALRSDSGIAGIEAVLSAFPDALLLAGTVLTGKQAEAAIGAGAAGVVSADYIPDVVEACVAKDIMCVPGGLCDAGKQLVQKAEAYGCSLEELKNDYPYQWVYKLFPAFAAGRSQMDLAGAWRGPFKDLTVIYTGGITAETLEPALRTDPRGIFCASALTKKWPDAEATLADVRLWKDLLEIKPSREQSRKTFQAGERKGAKAVSFGETLLRLSPPQGVRLAQAKNFDLHFGGAEANVAVGWAQLGLEACYVSAIPNNELGDNCLRTLMSYGVDTRSIVRKGERLGIYYLEHGSGPRPSKVVYDRAHSAITELNPEDLDWENILKDALWFHWTGITPALGDSVLQSLRLGLEKAKAGGVTVSCDLNYRRKLWSESRAKEVMTELMPFVDVLFANEEDPQRVFGMSPGKSDVSAARIDSEDYKELSRELAESFDLKTVAISLRESLSASENGWSACTYEQGEFFISRKYHVNVVDRVGAGDAFASALIASLIQGKKGQEALEFAVAAACLKHSILGDFNWIKAEEAEKLAAGDVSGRVQR